MHNRLKWRAYVSADELDLFSLQKSEYAGWWTVRWRTNRRRYYVRLSEAYHLAMYRCAGGGGRCVGFCATGHTPPERRGRRSPSAPAAFSRLLSQPVSCPWAGALHQLRSSLFFQQHSRR